MSALLHASSASMDGRADQYERCEASSQRSAKRHVKHPPDHHGRRHDAAEAHAAAHDRLSDAAIGLLRNRFGAVWVHNEESAR